MPTTVLLDFLSHKQENSISLHKGKLILTDFQRNLWTALSSERTLSVSAPTSAGKSFALQYFIIKSFSDSAIKFVLYIVPTRALISQVADSFTREIETIGISIPVITIPDTPNNLSITNGIYILTQERTHILLTSAEQIPFDLIVSDEAQTLGAGTRGILLQIMMEKLIRNNPNAKFFFGSPFSKNPNYFKFLFNNDEISAVRENNSPVAQNLIMVNTYSGKPGKLSFDLYTDPKTTPLSIGEKIFPKREFIEDISSFAFISANLGRNSKSIIYSGSPAKCEDIADKIHQELLEIEDSKDKKSKPDENRSLTELSKFIRQHIHENYVLADLVERGIGFHYGKMPTLLRKAIEKSFEQDDGINFLVCTSTLLHGVNLPAKNLFILKPSEGQEWLSSKAIPMSSASFWNLAGRAGRLGKDFAGNVFLVNHSQWDSDPLVEGRDNIIRSSFFDTLTEHTQDILDYGNDVTREYDDKTINTFVKIYCDYKAGRLDSVLRHSPVPLDEEFISKLKKICSSKRYAVNDNIIENNIGIAPPNQDAMLSYILKCINTGNYKKLIPPHPLSKDCYQKYIRFFGRLKRYFVFLGLKSSSGPQNARTAAIAISWMRGDPYPEIIKHSYECKLKTSPKASLQTAIRETMDFIENDLRFILVQQSRCYFEILSYAFATNGLESEISSIPSISLFLELGACSQTMVNFIGLGLSRTTAGLLSQKASNKSMDREQVIKWLTRQNLYAYDLPTICIEEINNVKNVIR